MIKYLITGFSGFVSKHFLEYLDACGEKAEVYGIDINQPDFDLSGFTNIKCYFREINLLNKDDISNVLFQVHPDFILHLASFSSVAYSWNNPVASFVNNTNIFLNLVEQLRVLHSPCRMLSVGSSEEYGNVNKEDLPLKENGWLNPISPYAVARVSQELLSRVFVDGYGMDIVMTRSFNHMGPGQKDVYAVSSFAKQLVESKNRGDKTCRLVVGDVSIIRDYVDVRDVVKAYYLLLKHGSRGETYNVCKGEGIALSEIVKMMAKILDVSVEININKDLFRPNDNRIIVGSNKKIFEAVGWTPKITLEDTLKDVIDYWSSKLILSGGS